eukprot:TRINITY_DN821_c3_g1_i1.p1 TRINITY_DN821_c3_g1~~TRINITY_DN821_c3_g1_i1.p1  ORF type:complete len:160 (-),score=42.90 TRINITY_DN821_c3_g1_i1:123-602(-)
MNSHDVGDVDDTDNTDEDIISNDILNSDLEVNIINNEQTFERDDSTQNSVQYDIKEKIIPKHNSDNNDNKREPSLILSSNLEELNITLSNLKEITKSDHNDDDNNDIDSDSRIDISSDISLPIKNNNLNIAPSDNSLLTSSETLHILTNMITDDKNDIK